MSIIKIASDEATRKQEEKALRKEEKALRKAEKKKAREAKREKNSESYVRNVALPSAGLIGGGTLAGLGSGLHLGHRGRDLLTPAGIGLGVGGLMASNVAPVNAAEVSWNRYNNQDIRKNGPLYPEEQGPLDHTIQKSAATSRGDRYLDHELENHGELRSRGEFMRDDSIHGGRAPILQNALVHGGGLGLASTAGGAIALAPFRSSPKQAVKESLQYLVPNVAGGALLVGGQQKYRDNKHRKNVYNEALEAQNERFGE